MDAQSLTETGTFFFPKAVNEYAREHDFLHYMITWGGVFIFVAVVGVMLYFIIRYRYHPDTNPIAKKQVIHNLKLEITWTIVPTVIVMAIFLWGAKDYLEGNVAKQGALEYQVIGQKWSWVFFYKEGFKTASELTIPVSKPVRLLMTSKDVIHSFYVPNIRLKRDVVPNRYTVLSFQIDEVGTYQVFCTEYCGDEHSSMWAKINVVDDASYDVFVATAVEQVNIPPVELGEKLYRSYGCNACHTLDGGELVGPSWQGLLGKKREFTDGSSLVADEDYIYTSMLTPWNQIVSGYNNVMPSFAYLSDKELSGLIEYIKTIK